MKPNDTSEITHLKYFKIERFEHGRDTNFSDALVFNNHRQQCPIAVSVEFADASGNTIPVTKAYVRQLVRFLDYHSGETFPFMETPPPFKPTPDKCGIAYLPNQYVWDEAVLKETQALYGDVEVIVERIRKMQSMESIQEAVDNIFSQPPLNARSTSGEHEYVESSKLLGHRWEVNFLKEVVAYELNKGAAAESPDPSQASGAPSVSARPIITGCDQANPDEPARSADAESEEVDDPERPRQRVEFYLYCQTPQKFSVAARLNLGGNWVSTVHPQNPGDDGYGGGLGNFNSAVNIIPVRAYQPFPPHPGFKGCTPGTNYLIKLSTDRDSPFLSFYEQYVELWLGNRHFGLKDWASFTGFTGFTSSPLLKVWTAHENYGTPSPWFLNFSPRIAFVQPKSSDLICTLPELIKAAAPEVVHYAEGRVLIGSCMWNSDAEAREVFDGGRMLPIENTHLLYMMWWDIYGTLHSIVCFLEYDGRLRVDKRFTD